MAVPRTSSRSDLFLANPSTYAPHFISPFLGMGLYGRQFGFGHRYRSLWCWSAFDCALPAIGSYGGIPASEPGIPAPEPGPSDVEASGTLRLDVQPVTAQVFVDGYYVGTAEDFSQSLAGVTLTAGPHHIEFRAPGYETVAVDVLVEPSRTMTYRATLKPQP
jgi:hypothetical protein